MSLDRLAPFLAVVALSVLGLLLTGRAAPFTLAPWTWGLALVPVATFAGAGLILQRHRAVPWDRIAWVAVTVLATRVLLVAAVSWKLAIPTWRGFTWDTRLAVADAWLHGGVTPDRWLAPLLNTGWFLPVVDRFYSVSWFVAFASMTVWAAWRKDGRWLLAMGLVWLVLGAGAGTLFASAGPAYYAALGLGDTYAPLMAQLQRLDLVALDFQRTLWAAYQGEPTGVVAGISAFPSLHVAFPALYACGLWRTRWRWAAVGFWAATLVGSVATGWHYAVDGYAGALGAVALWWVAGPSSRTASMRPSTWDVLVLALLALTLYGLARLLQWVAPGLTI